MRDFSDRRMVSAASTQPSKKRLGGYLVEAGLLTPAQVDVALNDQKLTGMRFGEILAARGWVKQQTIEYLMHKVVMPEQHPVKPAQARTTTTAQNQAIATHEASANAVDGRVGAAAKPASTEPNRQVVRRDTPIAKPLPSSGQPDGDISWVG